MQSEASTCSECAATFMPSLLGQLAHQPLLYREPGVIIAGPMQAIQPAQLSKLLQACLIEENVCSRLAQQVGCAVRAAVILPIQAESDKFVMADSTAAHARPLTSWAMPHEAYNTAHKILWLLVTQTACC